MRPSLLGLFAGGFLILAAVVLLVRNAAAIGAVKLISVLLHLSIAVSVHSLLHSNEEIFFRFNPLAGQWRPSDVAQLPAPAPAPAAPAQPPK